MKINSKIIILFLTVFSILIASSPCFAEDDYKNFGCKESSFNKVWNIKFTDEVDESTVKSENVCILDESDNKYINVTF